MKVFVKFKGEISTYLLIEWVWHEVLHKRVAQYYWVRFVHEATPFFSEEDAWATFDRSQTGAREEFTVEAQG